MPEFNKFEQKKAEFLQLVSNFDETTHGNACFSRISEISKEIGKTSKIIPILKLFMLTEPILWENIKNKVWPDEELQEENHFYFLQGDLLQANKIVTVDQARTQHEFSYCITRQPTCELVKGRAQETRLFRVSPCQRVTEEDRKLNSDLYKAFAIACRFNSPKFFPLPAMDIDDPDVLGYLVYLSLPYFLLEEDASDAIPLASLSVKGWHLYNAAIQHAETRANINDELALRIQT